MSLLRVTVVGSANVGVSLRAKNQKMLHNVNLAIRQLTIDLERRVKQDKLHGQVLHQRSGRLAGSIHHQIEDHGPVTTGRVGTNVEYAAIHEFGGTIPAHIVEARNASVLAFTPDAGQTIFRPRANIPDVHMPERSFLRSALADMHEEIVREVKAAVRRSYE